MLLKVYDCCYYCCSLYYLDILLLYFLFEAAIAAQQVTMTVCNKLFSSFNVVITVLYVVIINVTNDLDAVFAMQKIPQML